MILTFFFFTEDGPTMNIIFPFICDWAHIYYYFNAFLVKTVEIHNTVEIS